MCMYSNTTMLKTFLFQLPCSSFLCLLFYLTRATFISHTQIHIVISLLQLHWTTILMVTYFFHSSQHRRWKHWAQALTLALALALASSYVRDATVILPHHTLIVKNVQSMALSSVSTALQGEWSLVIIRMTTATLWWWVLVFTVVKAKNLSLQIRQERDKVWVCYIRKSVRKYLHAIRFSQNERERERERCTAVWSLESEQKKQKSQSFIEKHGTGLVTQTDFFSQSTQNNVNFVCCNVSVRISSERLTKTGQRWASTEESLHDKLGIHPCWHNQQACMTVRMFVCVCVCVSVCACAFVCVYHVFVSVCNM